MLFFCLVLVSIHSLQLFNAKSQPRFWRNTYLYVNYTEIIDFVILLIILIIKFIIVILIGKKFNFLKSNLLIYYHFYIIYHIIFLYYQQYFLHISSLFTFPHLSGSASWQLGRYQPVSSIRAIVILHYQSFQERSNIIVSVSVCMSAGCIASRSNS